MKRAVNEVASKLAEDSHKGINRRRHKSDRRFSQEIVGVMAQRGGDARESVLSNKRTFHERTFIDYSSRFSWYHKPAETPKI